jgi:5-methylcytosine-specific restriction endonuclease McrA
MAGVRLTLSGTLSHLAPVMWYSQAGGAAGELGVDSYCPSVCLGRCGDGGSAAVSTWRDPRTGRRAGNTRRTRTTRTQVLDRDRYICQLCHLPINPMLVWPHPRSAVVHHTIDAGFRAYNPKYLVAAHKECNEKAGSPGKQDPQPRGMKLW